MLGAASWGGRRPLGEMRFGSHRRLARVGKPETFHGWDCEVTWWANGLMSRWCHLVQVSLWVHCSSLVQVVRSIVTASFHFAFFHLGRLLRQMETWSSGWGVVFRLVGWWCLCVGMTSLRYDYGHLWNIFITFLAILAVLFQKKNCDRSHYDCQVDWSCGWVSTAHSNMWFSWVTEQSQDVAPFLLRTRASGLCFRGFHPCLTCSHPPKWQPAAHGNKQKLTNLSVQVHMHRLLEFEVVSCPPKKLPRICITLTYPPIFWRPRHQGQLLELPQRSPLEFLFRGRMGYETRGHDHYRGTSGTPHNQQMNADKCWNFWCPSHVTLWRSFKGSQKKCTKGCPFEPIEL